LPEADMPTAHPDAGNPPVAAAATRAARTVWAHGRRIRVLPPPSEAEVRRMVAEFQARGGSVTVCPAAHAVPVQNGAGRDAAGWTI
jgi:hypothetical protein